MPLPAPDDPDAPRTPRPSSSSAPTRGPVTLREATAFFVPLILTAELMIITQSVIHAWLARGELPTVSLAAFSIAFAVTTLFGSALRSLHQIALGFMTDRRSIRRVWHFGMGIAVANMACVGTVALTPAGSWVYGVLLGASPAVVREAQAASLVFAVIFPFQCTRNVAAGLLMQQRHTLLITYGSALRLLSLGALLAGFTGALHGAAGGAAAMLGCVVVESSFVLTFALPSYRARPAATGELPGYRAVWSYSWPLLAHAMLENGLVVLINVFVGRLAQADLALAAFGVARGLLMLMMSPLRNLAQTAQALTRTRADLRVLLRFARWATAAFVALVALLFWTPLRGAILGGAMGLAPELRAEVAPAVLLLVAAPPLWALAATYRGLLAGARHTSVLAFTGLVRLLTALVVASACLVWPQANGAVVGVLALMGAFAGEAALLGRSLHAHLRQGRAYAEPAASQA